jgi:hypothetical protein
LCYFLYLASPLTLSEVRSMLPLGLTADLASFSDQQLLKSIHPDAQTVVRILAGRCSCDLFRPRLHDALEDERHLRERYRGLGVSRAAMIAGLERHRLGVRPRVPAEGWSRALSGFIAEHARNAGPSLYYLSFSAEATALPPSVSSRQVTVPSVAATPESWLLEGAPTLVSR